MDFFEQVEKAGIVPVVVIDDASDAVPTAEALLSGGVEFMEITLRTSCALEAIRQVKKNVPKMNVGAGTVLSLSNAKDAIAAGASFIVSPGFCPEVVDHCLAWEVPVIPGCVTPTEITAAFNKGLSIVKFFPAKVYGGKSAIKELAGVFRQVRFLPTGGIDTENMDEYLSEPYIAAVGGSWVCPSKMIASHDFEGITKKCTEATQKIREIKKES
ncbi:MAG: bifunctional 4-hydroxy-2-oxoglutarate aldolase/2-dehydro-3-deoxy-phosphogluconate aldolase [Clostridiales bacterium]|nr:bifunctional 4-hydroxy-2-oxoglutarate aldolase/2-dehydro-3-deoxy-phosphogluconate aldolase [Clostridiales bacterium]